MKIAQIVCVYPPYRGGIGTIAQKFSDVLTRQGHQVINYTPKYCNRQAYSGVIGNDVKLLKPLIEYGNAAITPALFGALDDIHLAIFHYPFFGADLIMAAKLALSGKKTKLAIYYHMDVAGSRFLEKLAIACLRPVRGYLFKKADLILVSTIDYAESGEIKALYRKYKNKIRALPFSVDLEKYHPSGKKELMAGPCRILFVGGLDRQHYFKGVGLLINVLADLKRGDAPDWTLKIIGSGNLAAYYRERAKQAGILDRIDFAGNLSDKEKIRSYQEADFFVLPSINSNEAFGVVLLEAMASGLPVIASRLPGVRAVFEDGAQGYYFKPNDPGSLKARLMDLMGSFKRRLVMGKQARLLAEQKYGEDKFDENLRNILGILYNTKT